MIRRCLALLYLILLHVVEGLSLVRRTTPSSRRILDLSAPDCRASLITTEDGRAAAFRASVSPPQSSLISSSSGHSATHADSAAARTTTRRRFSTLSTPIGSSRMQMAIALNAAAYTDHERSQSVPLTLAPASILLSPATVYPVVAAAPITISEDESVVNVVELSDQNMVEEDNNAPPSIESDLVAEVEAKSSTSAYSAFTGALRSNLLSSSEMAHGGGGGAARVTAMLKLQKDWYRIRALQEERERHLATASAAVAGVIAVTMSSDKAAGGEGWDDFDSPLSRIDSVDGVDEADAPRSEWTVQEGGD